MDITFFIQVLELEEKKNNFVSICQQTKYDSYFCLTSSGRERERERVRKREEEEEKTSLSER